MTNKQEIGSLNPEDFTEDDVPNPDDNEMLIKGLLGPGLTVIGSEYPQYRTVLQEQMAMAVASGEMFLETLDTQSCQVLFVRHGQANYKETEKMMGHFVKSNNRLDLRDGWKRIGKQGSSQKDCISQLKEYKKEYDDFKLAFLGDFDDLKGQLYEWYKEYLSKLKKLDKSIDIRITQSLIRDIEVENINRLKDFAKICGVSIIIGHNLNTNKKLYSRGSLCYRDNEIHIIAKKEKWDLKVIQPSRYVPTRTWPMKYDENNLFSFEESTKKEIEKMKVGTMKELPLNGNEKTIIDCMWDKKSLTPGEIIKETGIPHSTVYQRLKALESEEKGKWVERLSDDQHIYVVDESKDRYWLH
ncbi:winged helix-turn-helix transcriptional regulator [Thermodesulfobacteriota bacterium]